MSCVGVLLEGESWVGVFYDAPPAVGPHHPVAGRRDAPNLLDVKLLEASAVVGDDAHPLVCHLATPLYRELLQVGAVLCQQLEARVRHLALACKQDDVLKGQSY